ncbi:D-2-hydroxyacid dehydrogenase [Elongatibacter sediminis]|uniref:D-2-hydroxyacid dehydrogenase n=1 Tax=Elongatibacter sediminis TaxID=3119006 RepID=A0AAW9RFY0_9GAMM
MKRFPCLALLLAFLATSVVADESPYSPESIDRLIEQLGLVEDSVPARERPGWAPPRRIAFSPFGTAAQREEALAAARAVAGGAEVVAFGEEGLGALADADVVISRCTPAIVEAAPAMRWMHSLTVGVDRCTFSADVRDREFLLTNNQRGMGPDISEHAIALLLGLTRNLDFYVREQQAGRWSRGQREAVNVRGKTLLVLGLGGIGTEIARRAHGLGMRVIATRNSSRSGPDFVEYVGLSDETLELAARADAVANSLPLTPDTAGLVGEAFFSALKPGAFYVSVGRGGTTDTDALVAALRSGTLGGAGLDVTDPEPLPPEHSLWQMDNVIITPHVSGHTDEVRGRALAIAVENLRRYTLGEPLLSVVDREAGY